MFSIFHLYQSARSPIVLQANILSGTVASLVVDKRLYTETPRTDKSKINEESQMLVELKLHMPNLPKAYMNKKGAALNVSTTFSMYLSIY